MLPDDWIESTELVGTIQSLKLIWYYWHRVYAKFSLLYVSSFYECPLKSLLVKSSVLQLAQTNEYLLPLPSHVLLTCARTAP
jgi:hypothetical protein